MSEGVTAGIDASLHVISKLIDKDRAIETANKLENGGIDKNFS